ncbi:hypothetical protein MMPV_008686 [Pyropia vietnamensis]
MSNAMAASLAALRANQAAIDALLTEHASAVAAVAARARSRGATHVAARAAALVASPVAGFWGRALKAHPLLGMAITPRDVAVLAYLTDVRDVLPGDPVEGVGVEVGVEGGAEGGGEGPAEGPAEEGYGGGKEDRGEGKTTGASREGELVEAATGGAGATRNASRVAPTGVAADMAGEPGVTASSPEAGGELATPVTTAAAVAARAMATDGGCDGGGCNDCDGNGGGARGGATNGPPRSLRAATGVSSPSYAATPWTFSLHFHFDTNPYFANRVLTKTYTFSSAGPVGSMEHVDLLACEGTPIDWAPGKNVTVKVLRRPSGGRGRGRGRRGGGGGGVKTAVRAVPTDSFFNFFAPPPVPVWEDFAHLGVDDSDSSDDSEDDDSDEESTTAAAAETAAMLAELFDADLRMATAVTDAVIPGAVHLVGGTFEGWRGGRPFRECTRGRWDSEDSNESSD